MTIELFGLPGAGKSTLAKDLEYMNKFKLVKISRRGELFFLNFLYFFSHPFKFFVSLFYIFLNRKNFYYKLMNCFFQHNAKYQKAKRFDNAVIDQGHFQNILSVFEYAVSFEKMKKYVNFFPKPDKLIILNIEPELAQERLARRGWSPRQNQGKQYTEQWFRVLNLNYKTFLSNIEKFNVDFFIADASQSPSQILDQINGKILK